MTTLKFSKVLIRAVCCTVVAFTTPTATPSPAHDDESFEQRLDDLTRAGDDAPTEALHAIDALPLPAGAQVRAKRLVLVARGIIAARNGRAADVRAIMEQLRQVSTEQPIAVADSDLVQAFQDQNEDETEEVYADASASASAYEEQCTRQVSQCDYRSWFRALDLLQVAADHHGNVGMATSAAAQMLKIARDAGDRRREAKALAVVAVVAQINAQPALAARRLEEATSIASSAGDAPTIVDVDTLSGIVHFYKHDYESTRVSYLAGLDLAERAHLSRAAAHIRANLGDDYFRLNQPAQGLAMMAPALAEARSHGSADMERLLLHNTTLAEIALRRPQYHDDLKRVLALWARSRSARVRVEAFQELSSALVAAGDTQEALELFKQEQQIVFSEGNDHDQLARLLAQQEAVMRGHDSERHIWQVAVAAALLAALGVAGLVVHLRRRNRRLALRNDALYREAHLDPLTGLANRHGLDAIVDDEGDHGIQGLLYVIDLDHFKRINDSLGHAAGDAVLVEVARRLRSITRDTDVVVRWGGEEFLIFVRSLGLEDARDLARRLLSTLADTPIALGPCELRVSASIGYARFPMTAQAPAITLDQAFSIVDAAMYRSKSQGRNRATGVTGAGDGLGADPDRLSRTFSVLVSEGLVSLETILGPLSSKDVDLTSPTLKTSADADSVVDRDPAEPS